MLPVWKPLDLSVVESVVWPWEDDWVLSGLQLISDE